MSEVLRATKTMRLNSRAIERKIVILCNDHHTPEYYGRVYNFAKELARKNSVNLVSITNEGFKFKVAFEVVESLILIKITIPRIRVSFLIQTIFFLLVTSYLCIFKKMDLIMATNPIPGFAATIISKIFRIPPVFDFLDNFKSYSVWLKHPFSYSIVERIIVSNVENLVFASDTIQEDVNHRYVYAQDNLKTRQVVVPNGVDVRLFHPMEKAYARKETNLPLGSKIILYSGAIERNRGILTLFEAFGYLLKELPGLDVYLVITGKGHALPDCRVLASKLKVQDKILFAEWLPHHQIPLYINSADVTVLPNAENEFTRFCYTPLKLMEYMACAKPVVITDVGKCAKLVGNERGLVVPPEDPRNMARALKILLIDEERAHKLGLKAYELATKNFSWNSLVSKLEQFLEKTWTSSY